MVFVDMGDDVIDLDLDLLIRLLAIVDQEITRVEAECAKSPDADAFGLYDRIEGLVGLGFAACQQYMAMTYRQVEEGESREVVQAGPSHEKKTLRQLETEKRRLDQERKRRAIEAGPKVAIDVSYAEVINAAANFWKHHGEWDHRAPSRDEKRTRAVLDPIFPSSDDYPLANVLHGLLKPEVPRRFASVVPLLEGWRNAFIGRTRPDPTP